VRGSSKTGCESAVSERVSPLRCGAPKEVSLRYIMQLFKCLNKRLLEKVVQVDAAAWVNK
jgi:hypothetical protein